MMIVFVGDKPSTKNTDLNVPFIGTQSHKTLLKWIEYLGINEYILFNSHTEQELIEFESFCKHNTCLVVALGNNAARAMKRYALDLLFFTLPHPSPRNLILNDSKFVTRELDRLKDKLKGWLTTPSARLGDTVLFRDTQALYKIITIVNDSTRITLSLAAYSLPLRNRLRFIGLSTLALVDVCTIKPSEVEKSVFKNLKYIVK